MSNNEPGTAYDRLLYPDNVRVQTHPDRLATIATLFGMNPPPVEHCRVLELGCGNGSNLGPIAWSLPDSELMGVDAASVPIAHAQEMAAAVGLKNVTFRACDILNLGGEIGQFDYIICHGVYSWVPPAVQEKILALCQAHLAPQGVAFISYNTLPGNHLSQMIRDIALFHVQNFETPEKQLEQALALGRFIADAAADTDLYRQYLKQEMALMLRLPPNYVLHDLLASVNHPAYFYQFAEAAARHQLQYLGEADFHEMLDHGFKPEVVHTLNQMARNRVQREQYLDFLKCRRFRQTLLCHAEAKLDLSLKPEVARRFHVAALATPSAPAPALYSPTKERFTGPGDAYIVTESPVTKVALSLLNERWPRSLPFDELAAQVRQRLQENHVPVSPDPQVDALALGEAFLRSYAAGMIELHLYQPRFAERISERPRCNPLARWQARRGNFVSSVYHRVVAVEDEPTRLLIDLLDGTRDRATLQADFLAALQNRNLVRFPTGQALTDPQQVAVILAAEIEKNLARMARLGLLTA